MNCKNCGFLLTENDQFCKNCGTPMVAGEATTNLNVLPEANNDGMNQPMNNGMMNQPMNNGMINQPMNNGMMNQPMNNGMMSQPMNNGMMNQPMNNGMMNQPMDNGMINQSMNNGSKSSSNNKFIIVGIIALVVVVLGIVVAGVLMKKDDATNEGEASTEKAEEKKSTYKVNFKGFQFLIPTDWVYEVKEGYVAVGDEDGTWSAVLEVVSGSYNQLLVNKNQLQGIYQSLGYSASAAVEKTIDGMNFITLELSSGGQNMLMGITKANSMNMFGVTIYTIENDFDYELLKKMVDIFESAEYVGDVTANMTIDEKIDMNVISGLAK